MVYNIIMMINDHHCHQNHEDGAGKSSCNVRALTYCDLHKIMRDDLLEVGIGTTSS